MVCRLRVYVFPGTVVPLRSLYDSTRLIHRWRWGMIGNRGRGTVRGLLLRVNCLGRRL